MIRFEDQCVGCPPEMGCLGSACPYMNVPVLICDKCKDYVDDLFWVDGQQFCKDCLLEQFEMVDVNDG